MADVTTTDDTQATRGLGLPQAIALIVGSIIGVGIFNLPASLAKYGPISIWGMVLTTVGAGLGAVAALLAGSALRQMLFEVSHRDVVTFGVVIGAILVTGVAASWLPALRVTRQPTASVLNR